MGTWPTSAAKRIAHPQRTSAHAVSNLLSRIIVLGRIAIIRRTPPPTFTYAKSVRLPGDCLSSSDSHESCVHVAGAGPSYSAGGRATPRHGHQPVETARGWDVSPCFNDVRTLEDWRRDKGPIDGTSVLNPPAHRTLGRFPFPRTVGQPRSVASSGSRVLSEMRSSLRLPIAARHAFEIALRSTGSGSCVEAS